MNDRCGAALNRAVDEKRRLDHFASAAIAGISIAHEARTHVRLAAHIYEDAAAAARALEDAAGLESFARDESGRGFSYVYELATLRLWTIIEVAVEDVVFARCRSLAELPADGLAARLTGPLLPFVLASDDDRAHLLARAMEDKLATGLKPGFAGFAAALEAVGVGVVVPDAVRRVAIEFANTRNVITHRNGVVDGRFRDACPWLRVDLGARRVLVQHHYLNFGCASVWFLGAISVALGHISAEAADQVPLVAAIETYMKERPDLATVSG